MASEGVKFEEGCFVNDRGMRLFTCNWTPAEGEIKALVFLCHGYGMDCSVFTKATGETLAKAGYVVYGIDYEGHGKSEGLPRAYIKSFDNVVRDCCAFFQSVKDMEQYNGKKSFLYGESMGGAVALLAQKNQPTSWDGAVLLAPMCKISDKIKPPGPVLFILKKIARVFPTWAIVPSPNIIDQAFRDPVKREQIRSNPYAYKGKPRLRTALQLRNASNGIAKTLQEVSVPFLVLHGEADTVNDPEISKELHDVARSHDKTIKLYPKMWHGLTTAESEQDIALVFGDMIQWLNARAVSSTRLTTELSMKLDNDKPSLLLTN